MLTAFMTSERCEFRTDGSARASVHYCRVIGHRPPARTASTTAARGSRARLVVRVQTGRMDSRDLRKLEGNCVTRAITRPAWVVVPNRAGPAREREACQGRAWAAAGTLPGPLWAREAARAAARAHEGTLPGPLPGTLLGRCRDAAGRARADAWDEARDVGAAARDAAGKLQGPLPGTMPDPRCRGRRRGTCMGRCQDDAGRVKPNVEQFDLRSISSSGDRGHRRDARGVGLPRARAPSRHSTSEGRRMEIVDRARSTRVLRTLGPS